MMLYNNIDVQTVVVNDPTDYQLPYRLVSITDNQIMLDRYRRLVKQNYGAIIRLGVESYG